MLIDFTVENFRSIKDPVTLSMVAAPTKKTTAKTSTRRHVKPDDEIAPPFRHEARHLSLLPALGIFGANASGKSNVVEALNAALTYMWFGSHKGESLLPLVSVPFGLSDSTKERPTSFELRVIRDNAIFTYTLVLNDIRVVREKLSYIPPESRLLRNRLLFERVWHEDRKANVFTNGEDFGNAYREIQGSLREHEPFLHLLATRLDVEVIRPFVTWLISRWSGAALGYEEMEYEFVARTLNDFPQLLEPIKQIIRRFDTGVVDIEIEPGERNVKGVGKKLKVWVLHEAEGKRVRWLMQQESTGTQRLFSIAFKLLYTFRAGTMLLVDELGSNIHPNITRAIVRMFQSEKTNPKRAQLIFTSHDNTLQRGNLLRRDQIWFTQKRADGSTELYPLSDFKPRNDLAIDKAYLEGRFGAVPILPDEEELLEPAEAQ